MALRGKPAEMAQEVYEGIVVAQRLRAELRLTDLEPVDCVVGLAEHRLAVEVVLAPLSAGISGFYLPLRAAPLVVIEQAHPVQRQRFTIAHEIGHHALGHAAAPRIHGASDAESAPDGDSEPTADGSGGQTASAPAGGPSPPATHDARHYRPRRAPNDEERAANAFAGELLIPHDGARELAEHWQTQPPLDQCVRLSAHYGVSAFSAIVKLQVLGALGRAEVQELRRALAAGAHYPRYGELELTPLDDLLQRHADRGGGPRCSPGARRAVAALRAELDTLSG